jgi:hypothetical protein
MIRPQKRRHMPEHPDAVKTSISNEQTITTNPIPVPVTAVTPGRRDADGPRSDRHHKSFINLAQFSLSASFDTREIDVRYQV